MPGQLIRRFLPRVSALILLTLCIAAGSEPAYAAIEQVPGTTDAKFSVTSDGAASYSIPLKVAPGTAGLEPKIALTYHSRAGKSPYGFGWNIAGLTLVQRSQKNLSDDGVVRGVALNADDALQLDGEKLIAVADTRGKLQGGIAYVEYRTRTDSYTRVRAYDWSSTGPGRLVAETKAGLVLHFGRTANSRVSGKQGKGPVIIWLCDRAEDKTGNYMTYQYRANAATMDYQIAEISYTGNDKANLAPFAKVTFEYETLAAPYEIRFLDGEVVKSTIRLKQIIAKYGNRSIRTYVPKYIDDTTAGLPFFYLTSLTESGDQIGKTGQSTGNQTAYRPLKFSYTHSVPQWAQRPWLSDGLVGLPEAGKVSEGFRPIQTMKDGVKVSAVVFRAAVGGKEISGAYYFDAPSRKWLVLNGKDGKVYTPPVVLSDQAGAVPTIAWADVNGDGLEDLVVSGKTSQEDATYLSSDGGWVRADAAPFSVSGGSLEASGIAMVDIKAGTASVRTLMWNHHLPTTGAHKTGAIFLNGTAWKKSIYVPPAPLRGDKLAKGIDRAYLIDTDCDGNAELVYLHPNNPGGSAVYKTDAAGWSKSPSSDVPQVGILPSHAALQVVGKTAANCTRILAAYASGTVVRAAWVGTPTKWDADTAPPNILFWRKGHGADGSPVASVADLNADGQPDIFAYSSNGTARYAYLNQGVAGWDLATSYAPPLPLPPRSDARERLVFALPLQGTSRTLLMYLSSGPTPAIPRIFARGAGGGWEEIGDYKLPDSISIAAFNQIDLGVRFIDVNGDGYQDVVWSVQRGTTLDSKAWIFDPQSTSKKWIEKPEYALPEALTRDDYVETGVVLADVNGDGLVDLLTAREKTTFVGIGLPPKMELTSAVYINCSTKVSSPCKKGDGIWQKNVLPGLIPPHAFVRDGIGSMGVRAIDVNGDGLTDLVYSRLAERDPVVEPSPGGPGTPPPPDNGQPKPEPSPYVLTSITLLNDGGKRWVAAPGYMLPHPIVRQVHCPSLSLPASPKPHWCDYFQDDEIFQDQHMVDNRLEFIDINGDRLPDILYHYRALVQVEKDGEWEIRPEIVAGALINTGSGWVSAPAFAPPDRIDPGSVTAADANGLQVFFNDLNADGLPDLIYVRKGASKVFMNMGTSWGEVNSFFALPDDAIGAGRGDPGMRMFDINGDGLLDIVFNRKGGANAGSGIYLNTGIGWVAGPAAFAPPMPFAEDGLADVGVRPLDVNGDGLVDLIQFFSRADGTSDRGVFLNESGRPGLLERVTDGLGLVTSVSFESFLAYENRPGTVAISPRLECAEEQKTIAGIAATVPCDSNYPIINALLPGYIVTRLEVGGAGVERRSSTYRYAGYRLDIRAGKSLGFSMQEIFDEQKERYTSNRYSQEDGLTGQIVASATTQRYNGSLVELVSTASSWTTTQHLGLVQAGSPPGFAPRYFRGLLSGRESVSRDLLGKKMSQQKDEFSYDRNGNPTVVKTSFPDGSGSVTNSTYQNEDLPRWLLGRPTRMTITSFAPGKPSESKSTDYGYDQISGAMVRQSSFTGTALERIGTYTLDRFGNQTVISIMSAGETTARTQRSEYDSNGRFVVAAFNSLAHVTRIELDQGTGVVLRRTDPNGVVNALWYDGLQHVQKEISGSGVVTTLQTKFANDGDSGNYAYVQVKKVGSLPETLSFFDAGGRVRRNAVMGIANDSGSTAACKMVAKYVQSPPGAQAVINDTRYDRTGRLVETTVPRFCGAQGPVLSRRMRFDTLDRVIESTAPDGAISRATYDGLKTTTTNAAGGKSTTEKDIRGRIRRVEDAIGGTTVFDYDVAGRTVATTDAIGQRTEFTYDLAGRKTSSTDLVGGRWQFIPNAAGQLLKQIDPSGRVTSIDYDLLGRMIRRTAGTRVSSWTYDSCKHGVGRICKTETAGIDAMSREYDSLGRLAATTAIVGADAIKTEFEFDAQDRVVRKNYSTGVSIRNEFDEFGNFRAVHLIDGAQTIEVARATALDELGRVRRETLGTTAVKSVDISDQTGRVSRMRTVGIAGVGIQDLSLAYDSLGNVVRRADLAVGSDESYRYDALNRVVEAASSANYKVQVAYDAIGNIQKKSDVGTYSYCAPEGTQRTLLCAISNNTGTQTFGYDAAGNMTKFGDQSLTFDEDGHVLGIERKNPGWSFRNDYSDFMYGTDGQMVRQETRKATTKFKVSYLADAEILREEFTPKYFSTPERTRVRHHIVGPTGIVGYYEKTYSHYPFQLASPFYWNLLRDVPERVTALSKSLTYLVKDQLGTIQALLDASGTVVERMEFDAWGKRRDHQDGYRYRNVRTGFTSHEHLDSFDLIHMQGRVYSPLMARFLSPDVLVQFPLNTQSFNRYAYVLNNPLRYIDPSGFDFWGDVGDFFEGAGNVVRDVFDAFYGKPIRWTGEQLQKAGVWLEKNWRIVVIVAVAIAAPYLLPAMSAIAIGAITGAAVGALSAALYGGNIDDVLRGAMLGAITGALTGGVAEYFGEAYSVGRVFSEGAVGGLSSHIRGGNFSEGFIFAFAMAAVTYANQEMRRDQLDRSKQTVDGKGNNLEPTGEYSEGKFGLKDKLGGSRKDLDTLDCSGGVFGGCQSGPGTLGFGKNPSPYAKGSFSDNVVESFAGPHDWMIDKTGGYWANGFGKRFGNILGDTAYPAAMLVPAAYFAAPAFVPAQARDEMRRRCSNAYGWCM